MDLAFGYGTADGIISELRRAHCPIQHNVCVGTWFELQQPCQIPVGIWTASLPKLSQKLHRAACHVPAAKPGVVTKVCTTSCLCTKFAAHNNESLAEHAYRYKVVTCVQCVVLILLFHAGYR